jgi:hypothetical protein
LLGKTNSLHHQKFEILLLLQIIAGKLLYSVILDPGSVEGVDRDGQLSVEALDERWGSSWRRGAEFQLYSRRKVIIEEIKRLVAEGREVVDIVHSLEEARLR